MDGGDPWISRLSSSSSSRRHHLRSEAYLGGDDFDVEDEYKQEFSCPFCAEDFDIVGLYIHIEEEHQVEVKQGSVSFDREPTMDELYKGTHQHRSEDKKGSWVCKRSEKELAKYLKRWEEYRNSQQITAKSTQGRPLSEMDVGLKQI